MSDGRNKHVAWSAMRVSSWQHPREGICRQLVSLAVMLRPWALADRVADAQLQLADDAAGSRGCDRFEQQLRLERITYGVQRVVNLCESAPFAVHADILHRILEIYAAAIACSALVVGCDELTLLAESKWAAWCTGAWVSSPRQVRWCRPFATQRFIFDKFI